LAVARAMVPRFKASSCEVDRCLVPSQAKVNIRLSGENQANETI
jgi:hypothetical protein